MWLRFTIGRPLIEAGGWASVSAVDRRIDLIRHIDSNPRCVGHIIRTGGSANVNPAAHRDGSISDRGDTDGCCGVLNRSARDSRAVEAGRVAAVEPF